MKIVRKLVAVALPALLLLCLSGIGMPAVQAAEADKRGRDYSELEHQIGVANGLDYYDYTKESWEVLSDAVEAGNKCLSGDFEQSRLDEAAEDIQQAMEDLVKMDYSALITALDTVYAKIDENPEMHDVWYRLDKAVDKARLLLVSGDQQAVNEMATLLTELMNELSTYSTAAAEPQIVVQEVAVEVEVPPADDFCNIPMHRTWVVLFVASAALNVLLVAALSFVLFRKRKTTDNTPLVNYDIDDDIDF